MFHLIHRWLNRLVGTSAESSRVIIGSTGAGKSEGELVDLVRLADRRRHAVILLDGHGPLAFQAAGHWSARGHESRIVYEPLDATDRVLAWDMLHRSDATDPSRRRLADAETLEDVAQCFMAQRNLVTLNDKPWTQEWLHAAIALCLAQPQAEPLPSLLSAFRLGSTEYERLLADCRDSSVAAKFRDLERLRRKNEVQYEILTGASRRLLELVCASEVVRLRSRPGPFDWLSALRDRRLIAFDGGGVRSRELKRTLFLLVSIEVIHAVRRHFAETQEPLSAVLVLEEAGALDLVTPFILTALQELRKAGLAIHLLSQSSLDFGDPAIFEAVLSNTPWQAWYQVLTPADQELGGKALTNATFDPLAVHFTRPRLHWPSGDRHAVHPVHVEEAYYKTPQLQEQEYRTRLATLRVGERIVRDRFGVRRERVHMLRPPFDFEGETRAAIDRIRRQPYFVPPLPLQAITAAKKLPDAAERLQRDAESAAVTS